MWCGVPEVGLGSGHSSVGRWCWYTLQAGVQPPRLSADLDVLVNARVVTGGVRGFVRANDESRIRPGRSLSPRSCPPLLPRSGQHRCAGTRRSGFQNGCDHYATRSHRAGPGRNPGTQPNGVVANRCRANPRPSLLGALVIKAAAVAVDDVPADQRSDLALLLSLIQLPNGLRGQLSSKDRRRLQARSEMLDPRHQAWSQLPNPQADRGRAALQLLLG